MSDKEKQTGWSIVMTSFRRTEVFVLDALEDAFPNSGIDSFTLLTSEEQNLPCEMATGLTHEAAELAAGKLTAGGFEVSVVPTSEVGEVKHRASDIWPTRSWGGIHFREVDGFITTGSRLNSLQWISKFRTQDPNTPSWNVERFLNHHHPEWDFDMSSGAIEQVMEWVDELTGALVHTYPDTRFTVSIVLGDVVTFWQTADDSPSEPCILGEDDLTGVTWCVKCQEHVPYNPSAFLDKRFEGARWGECSKCGSLLLIRSVERLIFINDPRMPNISSALRSNG